MANDFTGKIPFGPADIIVGTGSNAIKFDGKLNTEGSQAQAEGGSLSIEPTFADITSVDFGESPIDQYGTGMTVTVTLTALYENVQTLKLAIANTQDVTDGESGEVTGVTDAPIGQSNADQAVPVTIHPRNMGSDKSADITVYKMAPTENYERSFGLEQSNIEIQFNAYPRDGADASKGGNFFFTGAVDPNGETSAP